MFAYARRSAVKHTCRDDSTDHVPVPYSAIWHVMGTYCLTYLGKQHLTGGGALALGQGQLLWSPWEVQTASRSLHNAMRPSLSVLFPGHDLPFKAKAYCPCRLLHSLRLIRSSQRWRAASPHTALCPCCSCGTPALPSTLMTPQARPLHMLHAQHALFVLPHAAVVLGMACRNIVRPWS